MIRFLAGVATGMLVITLAVVWLSPSVYVSYFHKINLQTMLLVAGCTG